MGENAIIIPCIQRFIVSHHRFVIRYNILAAKAMADAKSDKSAAKALFEMVGLETEKYRLGHTKVHLITHPSHINHPKLAT